MKATRREFLSGAAAFAAAGAASAAEDSPAGPAGIRAVLLHWGVNMWGDCLPDGVKTITGGRLCNDSVKFDEARWRALVAHAAARRLNMVVVDLGEFPVWPSHPELALPGSRPPEWIRAEVRRLKAMGLEPIPKLNFSTAHDAWLGEYGRMVTTKTYYRVCRDIIRDAAEMFGRPRFLHIGYDEERASHQKGFQCVRENEVWWHDFLFFVKTVEDAGMRPWMWSDYGWHHPDFVEKCPKSVLQSNWYYDEKMDGFDLAAMKPGAESRPYLELYLKLDKAGFDQVPCASNWLSAYRRGRNAANDGCMAGLAKFCRENISPERLKGFMMATWEQSWPKDDFKRADFDGIDQLAAIS
jgi:hypothetical protein